MSQTHKFYLRDSDYNYIQIGLNPNGHSIMRPVGIVDATEFDSVSEATSKRIELQHVYREYLEEIAIIKCNHCGRETVIVFPSGDFNLCDCCHKYVDV